MTEDQMVLLTLVPPAIVGLCFLIKWADEDDFFETLGIVLFMICLPVWIVTFLIVSALDGTQ